MRIALFTETFLPKIDGIVTRLRHTDRKSTRLNSQSLTNLVCRLLLEKKKKKETQLYRKKIISTLLNAMHFVT